MLWQTFAEPQRPTPRGGRSYPTLGTSYHRAIAMQLNQLGRWRS